MNPIQSLIRTSAPASRSFTSTFTSSARNSFKTSQFQSAFRQSSKRWASDAAGTGATAGGATGSGAPNAAKESWLKRMWNSPVGIKTVHFWAPVMKWSIVLAGISDFQRPASQLSLTQNAALTCTGAIWTRWCFVIRPKNMLLAAVNFFLGTVGVIQVSRILMWQRSEEGMNAMQQLEAAKESAAASAEGLKDDAKAAIGK